MGFLYIGSFFDKWRLVFPFVHDLCIHYVVHGTVGAVLNGSEHMTSAQIGSLDGGALYTFIVAVFQWLV